MDCMFDVPCLPCHAYVFGCREAQFLLYSSCGYKRCSRAGRSRTLYYQRLRPPVIFLQLVTTCSGYDLYETSNSLVYGKVTGFTLFDIEHYLARCREAYLLRWSNLL